MSIIKQKAVISSRHAKNVRDYLNDDRALLHDSQNITNEKRWYREMDRTRDRAGHNIPARAGAKNTIMYHQVLAFLPDEADIYGGKMTPELCMKYAKEYAEKRYPNQQIVFALHKEQCKEDDTYRYAVHMAINRTNLETGKRLHEGTGQIAKRERARSVRELDVAWGLKQVEKDKPNSKIHTRQPRGAEKAIHMRGSYSYKRNLRQLVKFAREEAKNEEEFYQFLKEWGVLATLKSGKAYVTDLDHTKYTFRMDRLDWSFRSVGLGEFFDQKTSARMMNTTEAEAKICYQKAAAKRYQAYKQEAEKAKGTSYDTFPRLKLPRPPVDLLKDPETQATILSYIRKADTLRLKLAHGAPVKINQQKHASDPIQMARGKKTQQHNRTKRNQHEK